MTPEQKRILYVSYDGLSDPLGQSQILPYLTALAKQGFRITVLTAEKKEFLEQHRNSIKEAVDKTGITWQYVIYTKHPPVLSTLSDLSKMYSEGNKIIREFKPDIIHTRSYLPQLLATEWKKRHASLKLLFDIRGFWIDERIEGGIWPEKHIYKRVIKWLRKKEPLLYKEASHIVTLTHKSAGIIEKHFGIPKEHISVIPCATDTDTKKFDKEELKKELGLSSKSPVFVYSGSVGTWYMIDEMFKFFGFVLEEYPEAALLFFSSAPTERFYKQYGFLTEENFKAFYFPHNEVKKYLQAADAGLFFIKPLPSKQASSPTKMGEMLSVGLPVITNDIGDNKMILEKYGSGIIINDLSEQGLKNAVKKTDELLKIDKVLAERTADEFFSLTKAVNSYSNIYNKI